MLIFRRGVPPFLLFHVCFCCSSAFLSNNVQMLIDAAPRAANNSHTASDAKGVVMMNEGPHRIPKKKHRWQSHFLQKKCVCQKYPEVACGGFAFFCVKKKCRPSNNSQTHALFLCIPWPQCFATRYIPRKSNSCTNRCNSKPGDHNPRRKEIKSSYMRKLTYPPKTNISHLGKRKIILKYALSRDMLIPGRVSNPAEPRKSSPKQWEFVDVSVSCL